MGLHEKFNAIGSMSSHSPGKRCMSLASLGRGYTGSNVSPFGIFCLTRSFTMRLARDAGLVISLVGLTGHCVGRVSCLYYLHPPS